MAEGLGGVVVPPVLGQHAELVVASCHARLVADPLADFQGAPVEGLSGLSSAIIALPRHRPGRQRTSGRTAAERRIRHTEEVTYTTNITKSNLPKGDTTPET